MREWHAKLTERWIERLEQLSRASMQNSIATLLQDGRHASPMAAAFVTLGYIDRAEMESHTKTMSLPRLE